MPPARKRKSKSVASRTKGKTAKSAARTGEAKKKPQTVTIKDGTEMLEVRLPSGKVKTIKV